MLMSLSYIYCIILSVLLTNKRTYNKGRRVIRKNSAVNLTLVFYKVVLRRVRGAVAN